MILAGHVRKSLVQLQKLLHWSLVLEGPPSSLCMLRRSLPCTMCRSRAGSRGIMALDIWGKGALLKLCTEWARRDVAHV